MVTGHTINGAFGEKTESRGQRWTGVVTGGASAMHRSPGSETNTCATQYTGTLAPSSTMSHVSPAPLADEDTDQEGKGEREGEGFDERGSGRGRHHQSMSLTHNLEPRCFGSSAFINLADEYPEPVPAGSAARAVTGRARSHATTRDVRHVSHGSGKGRCVCHTSRGGEE